MTAAVFMLAVLIIYTPNQGNLPTTLGVMGLNMFNILFALALIAVMLTRASARNAVPTPAPTMTRLLLVYYALLGLSLAVALFRGSAHPIDDVVIYKTLVNYSLLYFLAYYGVQSLAQIRFLVVAIVIVFVFAGFEAILQAMEYGFQSYSDTQRASGPFGEDEGFSNFAGVFYAIFSTFCLAVALLGKRLRFSIRALCLVCYLIGCIAILATFSRQAMLAIGVTTLLLALRRNPAVAAIAILVMFAYPLWAPEGVVERIEMTEQRTLTGETRLENSAASRYELWGGAIEIIKRHPLGAGLNQFKDEVEPYLPEWVLARDAQNQYLRFAAESGIQTLIVFLLILWSFFRIGREMSGLKEPPEARALGLAFSTSVIAVCLGNVFSSTFAFGEMMANYWIMAGLFSRYIVLARQENSAELPVKHVESVDAMREVYARWQKPSRAGR